jgi:hypothetical protein
MRYRLLKMRQAPMVASAAAMALALGMFEPTANAQGPPQGQGRGAPAAPAPGQVVGRGRGAQTPQAAAPIDLTGYWVSVVTEDWRWRMVTPPKGDYASVPISAEGRRVADTWDPVKDERDGNACRAYGAAAVMRVPGRVHITWENENTLKIETDAGTQTRLLRFGDVEAPPGEQGWQGISKAVWEIAGGTGGGGRGGGGGFVPPAAGPRTGTALEGGGGGGAGAPAGSAPAPRYGSLKVVTTNMKPGYLRKNGVPYSENAVVTEYFDRHTEANGDEWFTVTTTVDDPKYLNTPFITSTGFKKERDGSKWRPTACAAQ